MRSSIDIVKQISKSENLENAAKLSLARKQMEQMSAQQSGGEVVSYNKENFSDVNAGVNKYGL